MELSLLGEQKRFVFQIPLSICTTLINLYCLLAILAMAQLRKTKFFLVATQSLVDFAVSGIVAFLFYRPRVLRYYSNFRYNFYYDQTDSPNSLDSEHITR